MMLLTGFNRHSVQIMLYAEVQAIRYDDVCYTISDDVIYNNALIFM